MKPVLKVWPPVKWEKTVRNHLPNSHTPCNAHCVQLKEKQCKEHPGLYYCGSGAWWICMSFGACCSSMGKASSSSRQFLTHSLPYLLEFIIALIWFWRMRSLISQHADLPISVLVFPEDPWGQGTRVCLSFPTEGWGSQEIYPPTFAWLRLALSRRC